MPKPALSLNLRFQTGALTSSAACATNVSRKPYIGGQGFDPEFIAYEHP